MMIKGIDVSKHQGVIDWKKVKDSGQAQFAILRAGYGKLATQKDMQFENNYRGCRANNIPCGAYWFSYALSVPEARQEALACLQVLKDKRFEYPIYFDVETEEQQRLSKQAVSDIARMFCGVLEECGYWVGVYASDSWFATELDDDVQKRYTLWPARVPKPPRTEPVKPTSCKKYDMWQYSWKGRIPGISTDVDLNECYKDFPTLMKQTHKNGY